MIEIKLNGQVHQIPESRDLAGLLADFQINSQKVAVARNLEVIPRSELEQTYLKNGDEIEIFHAVGGG